MATLNPSQIAQLAYNAGFRGSALRMAVAVALAESGGNTNAYNPEAAAGTAPNHGSRGLWQIYGTAHPQYDNQQAFDPQVNAAAAFQVYREAGNRFTPWSTYNNGSAYSISQNLNLDIPTGTIKFNPGTQPLGVAGSGGGGVGTITQTKTQTKPANPLVSVSLLPDNIKSAIENANPQFWKDSLVVFFLGLILLGLGGAILLAILVKPIAEDAVKVGAQAVVAGAI